MGSFPELYINANKAFVVNRSNIDRGNIPGTKRFSLLIKKLKKGTVIYLLAVIAKSTKSTSVNKL